MYTGLQASTHSQGGTSIPTTHINWQTFIHSPHSLERCPYILGTPSYWQPYVLCMLTYMCGIHTFSGRDIHPYHPHPLTGIHPLPALSKTMPFEHTGLLASIHSVHTGLPVSVHSVYTGVLVSIHFLYTGLHLQAVLTEGHPAIPCTSAGSNPFSALTKRCSNILCTLTYRCLCILCTLTYWCPPILIYAQ